MTLEKFIYALTGMSVDEYLKVLTKDYEEYLKEKEEMEKANGSDKKNDA